MLPGLPYEVFNKVPMTCVEGICGVKLFLVHTKSEWRAFYEELMLRKRVAVDTETNGFSPYVGNRIVGASFGWGLYNFYIPVRHTHSVLGGDPPEQLSLDYIRNDLQTFFDNKECFTLWFNKKFDESMFIADGFTLRNPAHDAYLMWRLIDENAPGALKDLTSGWRDTLGLWHQGLVHKDANKDEKEISNWRGLESKARKQVYRDLEKGQTLIRSSEIRFQGWKKTAVRKWVRENDFNGHPYKNCKKSEIDYGSVPVKDMFKYAGMDTFLTYKVYEHCLPLIQENPEFKKLYTKELIVSAAALDAEAAGVYTNVPYLKEVDKDLTIEIAETSATIRKALAITIDDPGEPSSEVDDTENEDINLGSTSQVAEALVAIGVPLTEKSAKTDKWKLDQLILKKFSKEYPICKDILNLRKIEKLQSTYVRNIIKSSIPQEDGGYVLHSNFNTMKAVTGRMSSSGGINLQNIPGKSDIIRKAFVPPPNGDYIYFFMDYSQVEVRLIAHFSQDPVLIEAYNTGLDVHLRTTCGMFSLDYDESLAIKEDYTHPKFKEIDILRKVGKILNFSAVYQVSPNGLAEQIPRPVKYADVSHTEWVHVCENFLEKYFQAHRHVKKFIIRSNRFVRANGYFKNTYGRIRRLPEYRATKIRKNRELAWMERAAERQGTNFGIQSEAADIFKEAIVRVRKILKGTKSKMIMWVHDEIQFYIHKEDLKLIPEIKKAMEDFNYLVPLVADVCYTKESWGDKIPIDGNDLDAILALAA